MILQPVSRCSLPCNCVACVREGEFGCAITRRVHAGRGVFKQCTSPASEAVSFNTNKFVLPSVFPLAGLTETICQRNWAKPLHKNAKVVCCSEMPFLSFLRKPPPSTRAFHVLVCANSTFLILSLRTPGKQVSKAWKKKCKRKLSKFVNGS